MMRNALIATVVIALALAGVWVWSLHPGWHDARPFLHPAEWARVKRKAAGSGFPYDLDRAKARIVLIERGVLLKDWVLQPGTGPTCWNLKRAKRPWRVCQTPDGRTRSVSVAWSNEFADSSAMPRQPALHRLIQDLVWITSPDASPEAVDQLTKHVAGRLDFGPPVLIGSVRLRGQRSSEQDLLLEAIPADAPVPEDWTYYPQSPLEYLGPPWPKRQ